MWYNIFIMRKKLTSTEMTLSALFAGKGQTAKRYAGRHVLVVRDKVTPLREGVEGRREWERLKAHYQESPVVVFVPRQDVSYILVVCR